ncbi:MAG: hypothetical protein SVG88_00185 [Halobacteriales archaeon]|nr:hypothetical protein [Halobacteriales archaeon]
MADELTVEFDLPADESFERSLLEMIHERVIAPADGIDISVENAKIESLARDGDGEGYRLRVLFVTGDTEG